MLSSKSWFIICSHRRWSDLLCSRRCLHDHSHQTLEKETLRYTPQLFNTVAKEIMRVEPSKQIRSQTCCSVTIDSKNHLVAPAVSTYDPVIQEDAHRRLGKEEQQALDLATEEERETARTIVSRLHVELGHSDPRGMINSLRRKHAHRLMYSICVLFSSLRKDCAAWWTQNPSVSLTLSDACHTAHFLISRHRQMFLMMLAKDEIKGWNPRSIRDPSSSSSFWPQSDAT